MAHSHRVTRLAAPVLVAALAWFVPAGSAAAATRAPTERACEPDTVRVESARTELANELSRLGASWNGGHSHAFDPKLLHPVRDEESCAAVRARLADGSKHVIVLEFEGFLFARPSDAARWQVLTSEFRVLTPGSRPVREATQKSAD